MMKRKDLSDPAGHARNGDRTGSWAPACGALCSGLAAVILLCACADAPKPNERVTGDCRALMTRCSSRQSTIDLTPAQLAAIRALQERSFRDLSASDTVAASASALQTLGYTVTSTDPAAGLVHAELDKVVATKGQRRGRSLVKLVSAATGLPIQGRHQQGPDHDSMHAHALVRLDPGTHAAVLRIEFENTVVDSKGNSQTSTPTDPAPYGDFFSAFESAAGHPAAGLL
jgi:hypothetical protein